jgi:hypothetical protein
MSACAATRAITSPIGISSRCESRISAAYQMLVDRTIEPVGSGGFQSPPTIEVPEHQPSERLVGWRRATHYLGEEPAGRIRSYVEDYLKEEIATEGLTRNLPAFSGFLRAAALADGQLVSYEPIAGDCGVSAYTVKQYFQISSRRVGKVSVSFGNAAGTAGRRCPNAPDS